MSDKPKKAGKRKGSQEVRLSTTQSDHPDRSVQQFTQELYSGLLPHPDHMDRYEAHAPGITGKLLDMVNGEQKARQGNDRSLLRNSRVTTRYRTLITVVSILASLAVVGGVIWFAVYLVDHGEPKFAAVVVVSTIAATVGALMTGVYRISRRSKKALEKLK